MPRTSRRPRGGNAAVLPITDATPLLPRLRAGADLLEVRPGRAKPPRRRACCRRGRRCAASCTAQRCDTCPAPACRRTVGRQRALALRHSLGARWDAHVLAVQRPTWLVFSPRGSGLLAAKRRRTLHPLQPGSWARGRSGGRSAPGPESRRVRRHFLSGHAQRPGRFVAMTRSVCSCSTRAPRWRSGATRRGSPVAPRLDHPAHRQPQHLSSPTPMATRPWIERQRQWRRHCGGGGDDGRGRQLRGGGGYSRARVQLET